MGWSIIELRIFLIRGVAEMCKAMESLKIPNAEWAFYVDKIQNN